MVGTALLIMVVTTLVHHLGFPEAVARLVLKVAKCPKCITFWVTLFGLVALGEELVVAVGLSFCMAYLSLWVTLLFGGITKLYNYIWQKLNK